MSMDFVNTGILRNPLNWLTVVLMLMIFGLFVDMLLRHHAMMIDHAQSLTAR